MAFLTPADQSAPPQPHHGQGDAQSRQDHAEQHEGVRAANSLDHPVEVHAEEASDEREGKEDDRHERQPIHLIGLALGDGGLCPGLARIQTTDRTLENLKREFTDPLMTLPQLFLKDTFSPVNYGTSVQTNQVIARAIIPPIPLNTLLPFVQLVRPTFSLITVPTPGGGTRTDLGDMQLFDLAVLPWPPAETRLRLGLGPTFVFPTATSKFAGRGAWQAGPACAAV